MFTLRPKSFYLYFFGTLILGFMFVAWIGIFRPGHASAAHTCSITATGGSGQQQYRSFRMTVNWGSYPVVIQQGIYPGSPSWPNNMRQPGNYAATFSVGSHTVTGNYGFRTSSYGNPNTWNEIRCSYNFTVSNTPSTGTVAGSCSAAGRLDVLVNVNDPNVPTATPGFTMHIDNVGDFGMDYGGSGWRGAWYPPRDGVTYNIWIYVVDPQTGGVYGPFFGTYNCPVPPPPPTPPSCSLSVNPTLVAPNGSSTLTWSSANATSFTVDQGIGALSPVGGGSRTVFPGVSSKTYTGTVSGPGGSANCSTTLTVGSVGCSLNSIATIEPGETYQPQVNVTYTAGGSGNAIVTATVTINNNGVPTTRTSPATTLAPGASQNIDLPPPITFSVAGNWPVTTKTISGTVNGIAFGPTVCGGATYVPVALKPYFKVFNGGTTVGAGFNNGATTCSPPADPLGRVSGFASSSPSLHGASTQYDLKALRSVATTFYSSGANPGGLPNFKALTFANDATMGTYGGSFGGSSCITDYYTTTKNTGIPSASGNTTVGALNGMSGDQVQWDGGNLGAGSLAVGNKLAIYVDGDVYITGNITLASSYPGGISDIPFFALVVKGNIMIAPGVSTLDGLYIAQPKDDGSKGTIYTCATGVSSIPTTVAMYDTCNDFKLTFNGSVVAKSIKLLRTVGTLLNGPADEAATSANIAEVFNGMPELFIANSAFKIDEANTGLYDSITSLPPLL